MQAEQRRQQQPTPPRHRVDVSLVGRIVWRTVDRLAVDRLGRRRDPVGRRHRYHAAAPLPLRRGCSRFGSRRVAVSSYCRYVSQWRQRGTAVREYTSRDVAEAAGITLVRLHAMIRAGVVRPPRRRAGRQGVAYRWMFAEAALAIGQARLHVIAESQAGQELANNLPASVGSAEHLSNGNGSYPSRRHHDERDPDPPGERRESGER